MVESASIRDPDNLDASYGPGDELTITFTVARVRVSVRVRVRVLVRVRVKVSVRVRVMVRIRVRVSPTPTPNQVDTLMPTVLTKWDIDKLLTFCTDCNPGCERGPPGNPNRRKKVEGNSNCGVFNEDTQRCGNGAYDQVDDEYNGLGTSYTGKSFVP